MGRDLTNEQKTQIANPTLKTRFLITVELDSGPFRILQNDSLPSMVVDNNTYYTKLIQTSGVETSLDGNSEKMDIVISDISRDFAGLIANNGDVLTNRTCKVEQIIFDGDTSTIVGNPVLLFEGLINNLQLSQYYCAFSVERPLYSYSTVSPNMTYDINCQFKFKDSRCLYSGTETKCDKTLARCQALNNVTRFGGYPSVVIPVSLS